MTAHKTDRFREGRFNYVAASVPPSLYRGGTALSSRDLDGNDSDVRGLALDQHAMSIQNARLLLDAERRTVDRNGFELHERPLAGTDLDFLDHADVCRNYYPQCEALLREVTGAPHVVPFDHNVRSASGKQRQQRIKGGQHVQPPAHLAHGDYTLHGAPQRVRDLARPPSMTDTLRSLLEPGQTLLPPDLADRALADGGRFAIINVWRNIAHEPVQKHPLALCDAQTVRPEDLVVFELHYPDRIGENYFSKHAPRHRWYSYPEMTRDEALLIKQWDSAGTLARSRGQRADGDDPLAPCTFSFHSAFDDPSIPADAPDRWSIEVRCLVLYT